MALGLHNLKPAKGSKQSSKRRGRGNASGAGNYSGRGQKGQRSRSGGRKNLKRRGLAAMLRNKPKLGGFQSLKGKLSTVNVGQLEKVFEKNEIVNAKKLLAKNLIKSIGSGVKVLGDGKLTKPLTVVADSFSESAKKVILEVGGKVEVRIRKIDKKPTKTK